jgi:hypothetical protein
MTCVVFTAQLLTGALAGTYLLVTGVLMMTWAVAYKEPGKSPWDIAAILLWPALGLPRLVRWAFTGKWEK